MTCPNMLNEFSADQGIHTVAGFVGEDWPAFFLQFRPEFAPRAHVLYLPPFGEEMNRCRALVATQARRFARDGLTCTILDFYGTGDSSGELCEATLPIWRQNIQDMLERLLARHACPVYLWGCRLGALLGLDFLAFQPDSTMKLLLWQPVVSGKAYVTQLLRQRSAALMQTGKKPESTAEMKNRLAAGETLEVAGYRIGGELIRAISGLDIAQVVQDRLPDNKPEIFWFEHLPDEESGPGARARRAIEELRHGGAQVTVIPFNGEPLWQLHKRASCDDLLQKTGELRW